MTPAASDVVGFLFRERSHRARPVHVQKLSHPAPAGGGGRRGFVPPELVLGEVGGGEDLPLPGDQGASWPEGL